MTVVNLVINNVVYLSKRCLAYDLAALKQLWAAKSVINNKAK